MYDVVTFEIWNRYQLIRIGGVMHKSSKGDVASLDNRPILTFPVVRKVAKS